jgi:transcriptional regulator with XRE-family HTH domain
MKFENNIVIEKGFEDLFDFEDESNEIHHNAVLLMFKFLSEVEKITENKFSKKDISKLIGTSASYVTQLFRGNKLINFETLAKLEKALAIEFKVTAISDANKVLCDDEHMDIGAIIEKSYHSHDGYWTFHKIPKENVYNRNIKEANYGVTLTKSSLKIVA